MAAHDQGYKQLFSHPEIVRDLLKGFIQEDWVNELDLSSLERVNGSYISDDLREREDDIIWKVRFGDNWIYLYVLIEFQSTVERFMAVRLITYIGLLYQDLYRSGQVKNDEMLPPVLPLVLYNGRTPWTAPVKLSHLIQDIRGSLARYCPELEYLLIDEQRYDNEDMPAHNLVSAIFKLEKSRTPEDIRKVVSTLVQWLKHPEQTGIRRAFTVWINRVLLPVRLKGQEMPNNNDLIEVENMLAERVKEWTEEWKAQGLQEGFQQGIQQGIQKGIQQGLLEDAREMVLDALDARFGECPPHFKEKINSINDRMKLKAMHRLLFKVESLSDFEAQAFD
jgi:predicted transposase/invertase (TIGR01784 family)